MAIAVQLDFEGATLADYDRVQETLGMRSGEPGAVGGLFHWVTATETGIRITDVWEDRETFERFIGERVMPALQQAGIDIAPQIAFFDVHAYLTAG